ncbi:hypothetical protein [Tropicimonas sp. TH_r6]|uniref:hypothetical protein n=1 Tax=Tropicimonas sp. TH_r6 TaxID=3082085 RepID=UPI002953392B|nr:hypothetical protein [Tropicimonas sp. TH_r6]
MQYPDRLIPLARSANVAPFFGDLHNHCGISYGHGSVEDALRNATLQLDFVSITGHAYWPDMPVDDPTVAHIVAFHVEGFARLERLWPGHFEQLAAVHKPGGFTVFPGYEMHSNAHGDYTIVLQDLRQRGMIKADTPEGLRRELAAAYGTAAIAFPHHIAYRTGARGINWETFDPALSPVVELISMHGCSESSTTDRPFLHSMGPGDGPNTIHAGWNAGHVFGVIGGTDHHSGFPGSHGHGRAVVYARENTSDSLWEAIRARHTGALTGDNCHLFARLGEAIPGDYVDPTSHAVLQVEALGGGAIDYIDVLRNGHVVHRVTPQITPAPLHRDAARLESIIMLELGWGARGTQHVWKGSLAVEAGSIDAVEPRLRGPEVVSPLEAAGEVPPGGTVRLEDGEIRFDICAQANPNNQTQATQALAARVRLYPDAEVHLRTGEIDIRVSADRLLSGAKTGNLGGIDTPAFRLHQLPRPEEWQWTGKIALDPLERGDWVALRMRQRNGQYCWSSPFFCR